MSWGRCEYLSKGRCVPWIHVRSILFHTFFPIHIEGRTGIHDACSSILPLSLWSSKWFQHTGSHSTIAWPDREESVLLLWLHFHSLCLLLLDLKFNMAWEKGLGENSNLPFHHIPSATGSYHIRSHLCKLKLKSVEISLLNRQYLLQSLVGVGESCSPCQVSE